MPAAASIPRPVTWGIAGVWLINGLVCKVLGLVPRHEAIVARILGGEHAAVLTRVIGCAEVLMAIWVVSRVLPRTNAALQVALIATMNALEFLLAADLLLWGRANAAFALAFIAVIIWDARRDRSGPAHARPQRAP